MSKWFTFIFLKFINDSKQCESRVRNGGICVVLHFLFIKSPNFSYKYERLDLQVSMKPINKQTNGQTDKQTNKISDAYFITDCKIMFYMFYCCSNFSCVIRIYPQTLYYGITFNLTFMDIEVSTSCANDALRFVSGKYMYITIINN